MLDTRPAAAQLLRRNGDAPLTPWKEARRRLEDAQYYWLATTGPTGQPHVMPVLGVWLAGALHLCTGPATRKGRNLTGSPRCVVTVDSDDLHLVVEGTAARVLDAERLQEVADAYAAKYGWHVTIRDSALVGDGAPTAGPPPYHVFAVTPTTAFGLGTDDAYKATRWRFA